MPPSFPSWRFVWVALGCLGLAGAVPGQTPAAPAPAVAPPTPSRLETLDSTYKANLRRLHAPVLLDYQRQLELLRQQLNAKGRISDAKAIEKELEQVKQLINTGGAMPYTSLLPVPAPAIVPEPAAQPPSPGGPNPPRPGGRPLPSLVLQAATARMQGAPADATAKTISPGTAEWEVTGLAAGTYDLSMVFAATKLDKPVELQISVAGKEISTTMEPERATGSEQTFRIFRLGRITLDQDASNDLLQLRSNLPPGQLLIRNVIFAEPRKPGPPRMEPGPRPELPKGPPTVPGPGI